MELEKNNEKEAFYRALSYIPLAWLFLYFSDIEKSKNLQGHVERWLLILFIYVVISVILPIPYEFFIYLVISLILAFVAYWDKNFEIKFLDGIIKKLKK